MLGSGFVEFKDIPSHESSIFAIFLFSTTVHASKKLTQQAIIHLCVRVCVCVYEE